MVLLLWVLKYVVEFHWPLSVLKESLPPPPLWMVMVQGSTLMMMVGASKSMFLLGRVATTLRTTKDSGDPAPFVPMWISCSSQRLTLVPSEP
jgi:hypothetical protein